MKESDINRAFLEVIQDKALMKSIGATKNQLYTWRNPQRQETKVGTKLEVLFKCNRLQLV